MPQPPSIFHDRCTIRAPAHSDVVGDRERLFVFPVPHELHGAKGRDPVKIKIFLKEIPEIAEICSRIDIASAKFELTDLGRTQRVPKSPQACKFVSFNIHVHEVKRPALKPRFPIVVKPDGLDRFPGIKRDIMVVQLAACEAAQAGARLVREKRGSAN
jgi:hypothetical protein